MQFPGGRKREFDVFIVAQVNGSTINIAVECKAFKKPVSVEKIEAFNTKCDRAITIDKKIFVSESGYQADAIIAAKQLNIELCNVQNVDKKVLLSWFPLKQLRLGFRIKEYRFYLDTSDEELASINYEKFKEFYFEGGDKAIEAIEIINDAVFKSRCQLWDINIMEFMKRGGKPGTDYPTFHEMPFGLKNAYVLSITGNRYSLVGIEPTIETWLIEVEPNISSSQTFVQSENLKAGKFSIKYEQDDGKTDVVFTKDSFKAFYTKGEVTTELKVLGSYDSKTGKFNTIF
jgi:hypothetical protein